MDAIVELLDADGTLRDVANARKLTELLKTFERAEDQDVVSWMHVGAGVRVCLFPHCRLLSSPEQLYQEHRKKSTSEINHHKFIITSHFPRSEWALCYTKYSVIFVGQVPRPFAKGWPTLPFDFKDKIVYDKELQSLFLF